MMRVLADNHS